MRNAPLIAILTASAFALSACAESSEVPVDAEPADVSAVPADVALVLEPVVEIATDADGVLDECAFEANGERLLAAGASEAAGDRGMGVIRVNGAEVVLEGSSLSGPDAIGRGPLLTDGDFRVQIEQVDPETDAQIDRTSYQATLTVSNNAGGEMTYGPGTWSCAL